MSYKPHVGKILPFDINAKTAIFQNKINNGNLNETKVIDTAAVKPSVDQVKKRLSIFKSKTDRTEITTLMHEQKLQKKNLETNLKEKKHRKTKIERKKNEEKDKRRDLACVEQNENQNPLAI